MSWVKGRLRVCTKHATRCVEYFQQQSLKHALMLFYFESKKVILNHLTVFDQHLLFSSKTAEGCRANSRRWWFVWVDSECSLCCNRCLINSTIKMVYIYLFDVCSCDTLTWISRSVPDETEVFSLYYYGFIQIFTSLGPNNVSVKTTEAAFIIDTCLFNLLSCTFTGRLKTIFKKKTTTKLSQRIWHSLPTNKLFTNVDQKSVKDDKYADRILVLLKTIKYTVFCN